MNLDPVEIWLSKVAKRYSGSNSTATHYRRYLERFCKFIGSTPEQLVKDWKNVKYDLRKREEYTDEMLEKVDLFENHLGKKDYCKYSIVGYLTGIQSFFKYMRIPVKIETFKAYPAYHNRDITKEEIKRILNNSTPRDKAFYLMMVQSGLRPMTLMKLTYAQIKKDFEANRFPCHIDVPRNMTKGEYVEHFTFMGPDAVKALKGYFRERGIPRDNETIFTGVKTASAFSMRFGYYVRSLRLIKPENMREGRKPQQLRLYCLRKYFKKMASSAGELHKFWMGHSLGVEDHYVTHDVEHHRKEYEEKAMPNLRIYETDLFEQDKTIQKQAEELEELRRELEKTREEIKKKANEVGTLQQDMQKLKPLIDFAKTFEDAEALRNFLYAVTQAPKLITISGPEKTYFQMDVDEDMRKALKELAKAHGITDPKQQKSFAEEYVRDSILERMEEHRKKKKPKT